MRAAVLPRLIANLLSCKGAQTAVPSMTTDDTEPKHAPLLPVFLIVLVDVFGMTLVIPLLAIYAETFHATALQATLLV